MRIAYSFVCLSLSFATLLQAQQAETPRRLAGVEYVSTLPMPHRWGVDFVKRGKHLFVSGSESERTFLVVDVTDPRQMRVVAETEAGLYAGRNLCLKDNLALINHYAWINAVDISDPTRPELMLGCLWRVDPEGTGVRMYRFQTVGRHLFVASSKAEIGFRIYEIDRVFAPRLIATVDLSGSLDERFQRIIDAHDNWYPNAEMIVSGDLVHTSFGPFIAGFDVRQPTAPRVVYCHAMPQNVVGLALSGTTFFVALSSRIVGPRDDPTEQAALAVVDLSEPGTPRTIGEYRGMEVPERMLADGNTLYLVGAEQTPPKDRNLNGVAFTKGIDKTLGRRVALHVLNVSHPGEPALRASLAFPFRQTFYGDCVCRALALDNGVLFVADQDYGIRSVDVANPAAPKLIGGLRTVNHEVRRVIPDGQRLYIVNGTSVHAADLSDPARPQFDREGCLDAISRWTVSTPVFGPGGRYLYSINSGAYEIAVADFGAPRGPRGQVANLVPLPEGWAARDLGWSHDRLFVLATRDKRWSEGQLLVYQPNEGGRGLKLVASTPLGTFKEWLGWVVGTCFLVESDRVFILQVKRTRNASGQLETTALDLMTIDISDPLAPRPHPPVDLLGRSGALKPSYHSGRALAYANGLLYLYALEESHGVNQRDSYLLIYDVRHPAQPSLIGSLKDPVPPTSNWLDRSLCWMSPQPYLALSSEWMGAWIVDVRDPRHPVTTWKEPRFPRDTLIGHYDRIAKPPVAYDNERLFVSRLDRVDIFQIHWDTVPARAASPRPPARPIARVPRAKGEIQIDGNPSDWTAIPAVAFERGPASAKWQWDEGNLYLLLTVTDPVVERSAGTMYLPHLFTGDHVDVFLTPDPAVAERPYGEADMHISVDLSGRVFLHHNNPRIRGDRPEWLTTPAKRSRAAVSLTADGYVMELALAHEETLVKPTPGAIIACALRVTDRGAPQMVLRAGGLPGNLAVQPTWPCLQLQEAPRASDKTSHREEQP
jgi:hypothetical protein